MHKLAAFWTSNECKEELWLSVLRQLSYENFKADRRNVQLHEFSMAV